MHRSRSLAYRYGDSVASDRSQRAQFFLVRLRLRHVVEIPYMPAVQLQLIHRLRGTRIARVMGSIRRAYNEGDPRRVGLAHGGKIIRSRRSGRAEQSDGTSARLGDAQGMKRRRSLVDD